MTSPDAEPVTEETEAGNNEEYGDDDADASGEDDDGDIDAEAEEVALRIGAQLWESMRAPGNTNTLSTTGTDANATASASPAPAESDKEKEIITLMKDILTLIESSSDSLVRSTFTSTLVPGSTENVLHVLNQTVETEKVNKDTAVSLSQACVELAKSQVLFPSTSTAIEIGKRKREDEGEEVPPAPKKRIYSTNSSYLTLRMSSATQSVLHALSSVPPKESQPQPSALASLISSIQLPLHQIFIFCVTASTRGGDDVRILQEIAGIIQVLSVLSGIPISPNPTTTGTTPAAVSTGTDSSIGTAIYPCTLSSCTKTFSRLSPLRAHQKLHSASGARPFHCTSCPARFARNHDLKRHMGMHSKRVWKCLGCGKVFSRRDAIKRHKNTRKSGGDKYKACVESELVQVLQVGNGENEHVKEERRAKMWNDISSSEPDPVPVENKTLEEGELDPEVIESVKKDVEGLYGILQAHAFSALGTSPPTSASSPANLNTLASVIARAQLPPPQPTTTNEKAEGESPTSGVYGLSDEQTKLLEEAIKSAASAAQAQAEAEAALEDSDPDPDPGDEDATGDEEDEEGEEDVEVEEEDPTSPPPVRHGHAMEE